MTVNWFAVRALIWELDRFAIASAVIADWVNCAICAVENAFSCEVVRAVSADVARFGISAVGIAASWAVDSALSCGAVTALIWMLVRAAICVGRNSAKVAGEIEAMGTRALIWAVERAWIAAADSSLSSVAVSALACEVVMAWMSLAFRLSTVAADIAAIWAFVIAVTMDVIEFSLFPVGFCRG